MRAGRCALQAHCAGHRRSGCAAAESPEKLGGERAASKESASPPLRYSCQACTAATTRSTSRQRSRHSEAMGACASAPAVRDSSSRQPQVSRGLRAQGCRRWGGGLAGSRLLPLRRCPCAALAPRLHRHEPRPCCGCSTPPHDSTHQAQGLSYTRRASPPAPTQASGAPRCALCGEAAPRPLRKLPQEARDEWVERPEGPPCHRRCLVAQRLEEARFQREQESYRRAKQQVYPLPAAHYSHAGEPLHRVESGAEWARSGAEAAARQAG